MWAISYIDTIFPPSPRGRDEQTPPSPFPPIPHQMVASLLISPSPFSLAVFAPSYIPGYHTRPRSISRGVWNLDSYLPT